MNHFDIPKNLCRKNDGAYYHETSGVDALDIIMIVLLFAILMSAIAIVALDWNMAHPQIASASIVKAGHIYTAQEFCDNF